MTGLSCCLATVVSTTWLIPSLLGLEKLLVCTRLFEEGLALGVILCLVSTADALPGFLLPDLEVCLLVTVSLEGLVCLNLTRPLEETL